MKNITYAGVYYFKLKRQNCCFHNLDFCADEQARYK